MDAAAVSLKELVGTPELGPQTPLCGAVTAQSDLPLDALMTTEAATPLITLVTRAGSRAVEGACHVTSESCQWHLIHFADATAKDDEHPGRGPPRHQSSRVQRLQGRPQIQWNNNGTTTRQQRFREAAQSPLRISERVLLPSASTGGLELCLPLLT